MDSNEMAIAVLIFAHLKGELNSEQKTKLDEWIASSEKNKILFERLSEPDAFASAVGRIRRLDSAEMLSNIRGLIGEKSRVVSFRFWKKTNAATAAVFLLAISGIYLWKQKNINGYSNIKAVRTLSRDIMPGRTGAILQLADGERIILDSMGESSLPTQEGVNLCLDDNKLTYSTTKMTKSKEVVYNTLSTPRGRKFQLNLPDGSHVCLNAESSIHYPVRFGENERQVQITGEVYFEVAQNAKKPFKVVIKNVGEQAKKEVVVLGTSFDIMAYPEERTIQMTLLEGSIKVVFGNRGVILKNGQQANANESGEITLNNKPDFEKVMAWRSGLFNFKNADIETVLRQVSRWYDIDIIYKGINPSLRISGEAPQDMTLQNLLTVIAQSNLQIYFEEGKIIVR